MTIIQAVAVKCDRCGNVSLPFASTAPLPNGWTVKRAEQGGGGHYGITYTATIHLCPACKEKKEEPRND